MSSGFDENYVRNYLSDKFEDPSESHLEAAYEAMNQYESPWWDIEDIRLRAGYQAFEEVLLMPVDEYKEGLSALLDRPVSSSELERNKKQLKKEVRFVLPQLEDLGIVYRENKDILENQKSGLEHSVEAAEDITDELTEDLDFEIEEDNGMNGSDFRIN